MLLNYLILFLYFYKVEGHAEQVQHEVRTLGPEHQSRRILKGEEVTDTRPYMVYLRAAPPPTTKPGEPRSPAVTAHAQTDANWLCGGVIIHASFVLTSAACIEDVTHFYIVSGTHTWVPPKDTNDCIKHGATRAVWKCVPKTYTFDGYAFNNIRWMENDIAVVMTADPFNFKQRVKGCDFVPQMIRYNNESKSLENAGTTGSIAGWGSTEEYVDAADTIARVNVNSPQLLEADVKVVSKTSCKKKWWPQYHEIIDEHMICGKPVDFEDEAACTSEVDCRELYHPEEKDDEEIRRTRHHHPSLASLHRSLARVKSRRRAKQRSLRREGKEVGGFCENDHGGPLITGHGKSAVVIGVMSAFRTMNFSKRCTGPFLYTSVFNNRNLIDCAIQKHSVARCRTILRAGGMILDQEVIDWGTGRLRSHNDEKRERRKRKKEKRDKLRRSRNGTRKGVLAMSPVQLMNGRGSNRKGTLHINPARSQSLCTCDRTDSPRIDFVFPVALAVLVSHQVLQNLTTKFVVNSLLEGKNQKNNQVPVSFYDIPWYIQKEEGQRNHDIIIKIYTHYNEIRYKSAKHSISSTVPRHVINVHKKLRIT